MLAKTFARIKKLVEGESENCQSIAGDRDMGNTQHTAETIPGICSNATCTRDKDKL